LGKSSRRLRSKAEKPAAKRRDQAAPATSREKESAGKWFERLVELQARLRAPKGCPWDIEQTHLSLRTYLIEEAYEVLQALETGDDSKFAEELGDLLLQVVFHAQIASEEGRFTAADVVREIHQKMVRRHPHVFGRRSARNAAEVLKNWEEIKAEERQAKGREKGGPGATPEKPESLLDGIPRTLPAVMEGFQLTRRASRIGFDWENVEGVIDKLEEELAELGKARAAHSERQVEEEVGDVLFATVNLARFLNVDPEIALKRSNAKFAWRFREMERMAQQSGRRLAEQPRQEMEALWGRAKSREKENGDRQARKAAGKR
jgi:MazG family protein